MLHWLWLPAEIRRLKRTSIFPCQQQLGLSYFAYTFTIPLPLHVWKSAKLMQNCCKFWGYFFNNFFGIKKLRNSEKIHQSEQSIYNRKQVDSKEKYEILQPNGRENWTKKIAENLIDLDSIKEDIFEDDILNFSVVSPLTLWCNRPWSKTFSEQIGESNTIDLGR